MIQYVSINVSSLTDNHQPVGIFELPTDNPTSVSNQFLHCFFPMTSGYFAGSPTRFSAQEELEPYEEA